jgi:hypothetical protein
MLKSGRLYKMCMTPLAAVGTDGGMTLADACKLLIIISNILTPAVVGTVVTVTNLNWVRVIGRLVLVAIFDGTRTHQRIPMRA